MPDSSNGEALIEGGDPAVLRPIRTVRRIRPRQRKAESL